MIAPVVSELQPFADQDAERIVLSALLHGTLRNGQFPGPELFFFPANRLIYRGLAELGASDTPSDITTLTKKLSEMGLLDNAGGAIGITQLETEFAGKQPELVQYELDQLHELHKKREACRVAQRMLAGQIEINEARQQLDAVIAHSGSAREAEQSWTDALNQSVITSSELRDLNLVPRKKLLGDWFCEGDLGFIFAFRGVGKTWLALGIAQALSTGGKLGDWHAHAPVNVLYIDGEMPPDLMRARCEGLQASNGNLHFLNHEILFERAGRVLNIANPKVQQAITARCVTSGVKVLILDNLSTLASGVRENEADSWEQVNHWLLDLRRRKIAVVIVHHAGRSGEMRGTSKREDNVFWIIALDDAKQNADDKRGARFISRFTKPSRNTQDEIPAYEWHVMTEPSGAVAISHKLAESLQVFRKWIEDGVTECSQLAEEMKVSKGTISKWAAKAIREGWLKKDGRDYALVQGADGGNEEL